MRGHRVHDSEEDPEPRHPNIYAIRKRLGGLIGRIDRISIC